MPLLAETGFPDELVMNYWPEQAMDYLNISLTTDVSPSCS